jgi:cyclophilin family peptidyl-prolyl cis-trans isomerase
MATIFVANALAARILNDVPMTNESKTTKTGVTITMSQCRGTSMKNVVKTLSLNILFAALCLGFSANSLAEPYVKLQTNMGDIVLELNREKAPKSVQNFLDYVNDGFYSGTIFHRVIDGFMIQGGGFTENFQKKGTKAPIENEADNGLKNDRGTVAMARTNNPHSATAQFFINVVNNDFLNHRSKTPRGWGYAVFGKVVQGMDVVDKIRKIPTGPGGPFPKDVPQAPVVIEQAMVIEPNQSAE